MIYKKYKYGNKPVRNEHGYFQSTGEWLRYRQLLMLQAAKHISNLEKQVRLKIFDEFVFNETGEKFRPIIYIADAVYFDNRKKRWIFEDFKGKETPEFLMKKKMILSKINNGDFEKKYPNVQFLIKKG